MGGFEQKKSKNLSWEVLNLWSIFCLKQEMFLSDWNEIFKTFVIFILLKTPTFTLIICKISSLPESPGTPPTPGTAPRPSCRTQTSAPAAPPPSSPETHYHHYHYHHHPQLLKHIIIIISTSVALVTLVWQLVWQLWQLDSTTLVTLVLWHGKQSPHLFFSPYNSSPLAEDTCQTPCSFPSSCPWSPSWFLIYRLRCNSWMSAKLSVYLVLCFLLWTESVCFNFFAGGSTVPASPLMMSHSTDSSTSSPWEKISF